MEGSRLAVFKVRSLHSFNIIEKNILCVYLYVYIFFPIPVGMSVTRFLKLTSTL